jgi:hypothetical protein
MTDKSDWEISDTQIVPPTQRADMDISLIAGTGITSSLTHESLFNPWEGLFKVRKEALQMAMDMAININHFEKHYPNGKEGLFLDIDEVYEIAEKHYNFIIGGKK